MLTRRATLAGVASAFVQIPSVAFAADDALDSAMEGTTVPGMAALVIRGGRVQRELTAGVRRLGAASRVARGDRWHLGSDGKAMTATMIARLVELSVLSWDAPLDQMLPGLAGGMHEAYRDVTLPDLLSHRSGLPENVASVDFFNTFYADASPPQEQRLRYIAAALAEPPAAAKRAAPSYSNTGFLVAAAAAERALRVDFEALMRSYVFNSLRIRSISFDQYGGAGEPAGHVDGRVADQPHDANPRMFAPAGGMRVSLRDWARFCIDHLDGENGQGRLLRPESYRFLHAEQGRSGSALGWGVQHSVGGRLGPALVHAGSDGNWYALAALFPATGNGVLVAANAADSMGGNTAAIAALRALAAGVAAAT